MIIIIINIIIIIINIINIINISNGIIYAYYLSCAHRSVKSHIRHISSSPVEVALMSLLVTGLQGRHHDASPPTRAKKNGANIFGWDVLECH